MPSASLPVRLAALTTIACSACIPMTQAAPPQPAVAEAPTTTAAPAEPPPAAIPQLELKESGFVFVEGEATRPLKRIELLVSSGALTEMWIRIFNEDGQLIRPQGASLCAPEPGSRDCAALKPSELKVGLAGTRHLQLSFEYPTRVKIQLVTGWQHLAWTELAYGAPASDAPVKERDLGRWGILNHQVSSGWTNAHAAFTRLPRTFVVYATTAFPAVIQGQPREIAAGEPLLRVGSYLLRANGEVVVSRAPRGVTIDQLVSATRPETIVMPPAWVDTDGGRSDVSMYHYPYGDDAAELAGFDAPERDAFLQAREPVKACIGRELAKRGSGFGYDVATYKKDGTVKKVQSLTSYLEDQVYKVCNVGKLDKQRAKVRTSLRARALAEIKAALAD